MSAKAKSKTFFNPLPIATAVFKALTRDLDSAQLEYADDRYALQYRNSQREAFFKKYEGDNKARAALKTAAFKSFIVRNRKLRVVNDLLAFNMRAGFRDDTDLAYVLRRARAFVAWALGDITTDEVFEAARHSGGVTLGVRFADTSLRAKMTLPMTSTLRASKIMDHYLTFDQQLKAALQADQDLTGSRRYEIVEESRAETVPKNDQKDRMIAVEPTVNMYLQQGLMMVMYKRLSKVGLDVTRLPRIHKILAMEASVTGLNATIDFSNASDSVSTWLVRCLFPAKWALWLESVRCPSMQIDGSSEQLECYATMGNSTTFPVETLVFYSLAVACVMRERFLRTPLKYRIHSTLSEPSDRTSVSVFGDDCILPSAVAPLYIEVCGLLGFDVNVEKTFYKPGPGFRESCGGDYLHGRDVRPFYLRTPVSEKLSSLEPWLYTIMNGLHTKYVSYFGPLKCVYGKELWEVMDGLFRQYKLMVKFVPPDYPDDSGLKDPNHLRWILQHRTPVQLAAVDEHGTSYFKYCRFKYSKTELRSDHVSLAEWLKRPTNKDARFVPKPTRGNPWLLDPWSRSTLTESSPRTGLDEVGKTPVRRKGGYLTDRKSVV